MKRTIKLISITIALMMLIVLPASAIGKGYACFREKNLDISPFEHAGLVVELARGGDPDWIVHHPGTSAGSRKLEMISLNAFQIDGRDYYGTYYKSGSSTVNTSIANKAEDLLDFKDDIGYSLVQQLQADITGVVKIEPRNIEKIRCDGVVEYCYEYCGVQLLGRYISTTDTTYYWNISNPLHYVHHDVFGFTPDAQRDAMIAG